MILFHKRIFWFQSEVQSTGVKNRHVFANANDASRASGLGHLVSPENMNFMARDILDPSDLQSPYYKSQLQFYRVQFNSIERARKSKVEGHR